MRAPIACPRCGRDNEIHRETIGQADPEAGDISLCWGCRRPALYTATAYGLVLRLPTPTEDLDLEAHPEVRRALAAMAESYFPDEALTLLRPARPAGGFG